MGEYSGQEFLEFLLAHLARCHSEFIMPHTAIPTRVTMDGNVVRSVREYNCSLFAVHEGDE